MKSFVLSFLFFCICSPSFSLSWLEEVDQSFGTVFGSCDWQESDVDEYFGYRCTLPFWHRDDHTYRATPEVPRDFNSLIDNVVFSSAALEIYNFNKCQTDFYEHYMTNELQEETSMEELSDDNLVKRAWNQFQISKSDIRQNDEVVQESLERHLLVSDMVSCTSYFPGDCAMNFLDSERAHQERTIENRRSIQELVSAIPMGNRPSMKSKLLELSNMVPPPTAEEFRSEYNKVIKRLATEASDSFAAISEKSYESPVGSGKRYFHINRDEDAAFRRSLVTNGLVHNALINAEMDPEFIQNVVCRHNSTYVDGANSRMVAEIAASILIPTAGVMLRARSALMLGRLGLSSRAMNFSTIERSSISLMLFGAGLTTGMEAYGETYALTRDMIDSCMPEEYLASKASNECNPEKQMYEIKSEASIVACLSTWLLPGTMTAASARKMFRNADDVARMTPAPISAADEIASEADEIIVRAPADTIAPTPPRSSGVSPPSSRLNTVAPNEILDEVTQELPPSTSEQLLRQNYATRSIADENANEAFLELARQSEPQPGVVFIDSQNQSLKWLNDNLEDKALVDALTNRHNAMIQEALIRFQRENPSLSLLPYSDYKGARFAIRGPPGAEDELMSQLRRILDEVDDRFMQELRDNNYTTITTEALGSEWFGSGIGRTGDHANVQARFPPFSTWSDVTETFQLTQGQISGLRMRYGDTPLISRHGTPTPAVFELLRKKSDNSEVARILNNRHGLNLGAENIQQFRDYFENIDQFSPGLLLARRESHDFSAGVNGGMTIDFAGVGSLNAEATARALAENSDLNDAIAATRIREGGVTDFLDGLKTRSRETITEVLGRHNITVDITVSGDDLVAIPSGVITPQIQRELILAQAEAGVPSSMRVSFFPAGMADVNSRAVIAAQGEGIEKTLRARLESRFTQDELRSLIFATNMQGTSPGSGAVELITNGGLTGTQQRILQEEFTNAVRIYNQRNNLNFAP